MGRNKKSGVAKPKKKTDAAFSKQKKKVGKKVLKSNETIISIKTRKIALPEQHASKNDNVVFKGKNISEYITGTKHTNSNQRVQNVVNIQEMLSANLQMIEPNAGALIERLGVILQDPEENVRASVIVLAKTILCHIRSKELLPFLQVFIAQLSSGLLHIDKGTQKTTVLVLVCLFQNHLTSAMSYSEPLLSSLVTLLSTCRNKQNTLLYFQAVSYVLKFYIHSEDTPTINTVRTSPVHLYKYTSRQEASSSRPSSSQLLSRVCECALPHVETIWLEDTPSQIYALAEPSVLKTSGSLVDFLILIHKSELNLSKPALIKLHNIGKAVAGRFPLTCSVPDRDSAVLWSLNLKIARFLILVEKLGKVERYFVHYFSTRLKEMTGSEVSEGLSLLSRIPSPRPETISALLDLSHGTHAPLFLSHFVRTACLHSVDLNGNTKFLSSLKLHIKHVAPDIVNSLYSTKRSVPTENSVSHQMFSLCLEQPVFASLSESEQIKCLELFFRDHVTSSHHVTSRDHALLSVRDLAGLGHAAKTSSVRAKFYSILQALLHEDKIAIEDYISILLTQANKDDKEGEEEEDPNLATLHFFTTELLHCFSPLPAAVRHNLFSISLEQIVERLYAGLSRFSLAAYLLILLKFTEFSLSEGVELELGIPENLVVKLGKIMCSLIFNKDSLSDWGGSIVKLAVKLSVSQHVIFRYITQLMKLENKSDQILSWYVKIALKFIQCGDVLKSYGSLYKTGVDKLMEYLKGRISVREFQELGYRTQAAFGDLS